MNRPSPARVLTVLDDASVARTLMDTSSVLAQLMHRELEVVYVQSVAALAAAELPVTQVLAHAGHAWGPLAPEDVERGWRVHAARLRALVEAASVRRAVSWSMRVTRGALHETALALLAESDLLLVAGATAPFPAAGTRPPRGLIAAFDDGSAAGTTAVQVAHELARVLGARLQRGGPDAWADWLAHAARSDLAVLPGTLLAPVALAALRTPALLVTPPR